MAFEVVCVLQIVGYKKTMSFFEMHARKIIGAMRIKVPGAIARIILRACVYKQVLQSLQNLNYQKKSVQSADPPHFPA